MLNVHCAALGRDPLSLWCPFIMPCVIGPDSAALQANIDAQSAMVPSVIRNLAIMELPTA